MSGNVTGAGEMKMTVFDSSFPPFSQSERGIRSAELPIFFPRIIPDLSFSALASSFVRSLRLDLAEGPLYVAPVHTLYLCAAAAIYGA